MLPLLVDQMQGKALYLIGLLVKNLHWYRIKPMQHENA